MWTKLVVSPNIADAACAVRATSSVSMEDWGIEVKSPTEDDPAPPRLISFLSCRIMSLALSKSLFNCTHSLVFSSS